MGSPPKNSPFESAILDQLDAAHNLARWLLRSQTDAQDAVQEACMKAIRAGDSLRSQDVRPWFLAIVRNCCFTMITRRKNSEPLDSGPEIPADSQTFDPHLLALRSADVEHVRTAIDQLPVVLREAIVLRELEQLTYREIGKIAGVPIGTVMSRLARGRSQLKLLLLESNP